MTTTTTTTTSKSAIAVNTASMSLADRAYHHIREKLLMGGGLAEGQKLTQESLAEEFGISRTPIREALGRLASEGLLERDVDSLGVKAINRVELEELLLLRQSLEVLGVGLAAKRATDPQLRELRMIFDHLRTLTRELVRKSLRERQGELGDQLAMTDMLFHMQILDMAGSPRLVKMVTDFHVLTRRYHHHMFRTLPNLARVLLEHWRIMRAVTRHDAKASQRLMRRALSITRRRVLHFYDQEQRHRSAPPTVTDFSALRDRLVELSGLRGSLAEDDPSRKVPDVSDRRRRRRRCRSRDSE